MWVGASQRLWDKKNAAKHENAMCASCTSPKQSRYIPCLEPSLSTLQLRRPAACWPCTSKLSGWRTRPIVLPSTLSMLQRLGQTLLKASCRPKKKFNAQPPVHIGFTSGSMDGVIGGMAEPQNLSRAAAFLSEGLMFPSWISDQNAQRKGLVTQLTDRLVWDKVTIKAGGFVTA